MICGLMKTNMKFYSLTEAVSCTSAGWGLFPVGERMLLKYANSLWIRQEIAS